MLGVEGKVDEHLRVSSISGNLVQLENPDSPFGLDESSGLAL